MESIRRLLGNNREWSRSLVTDDPSFFTELARQQSPEFFWIGCSDSRVSANTVVGLAPGEVFVHRNVANLVNHSDMNCLSVIQFAVDVLRVKHIIVCGHYGCGGVKAAIENERHGLIDNWLRPIRNISFLYARELDAIANADEQHARLCELNVLRQVLNVCETTIVEDAWKRGQSVTVHGWMYGLKDGLIRELGVAINASESAARFREKFLAAECTNSAIA
ncbi:MAG: carbonate dehydratase [Chloracidobacterium sp.]|nr:carbonate dehydratase [Chloracidobacterium sp.]MCC6825441.1 carbonate dehydratase [Acidobacteriota bacterium]MCO5334857.1 carbonate dehydratase [Pyrinomonadaceae bacterium]